MRNLGWVIALLLALHVAPAIAQDAPAEDDGEWYQDETIVDVTFEGLDTVSENELRGITEQYIGEEFTDSRFLDLQRRLYALDYFERVVPEAVRPPNGRDGVIIKFTVEERPTIREVVYRGNRNVRDRPLRDAVVLTEGDFVTGARIRADEEAIRGVYLERGFPDVEVSGETVPVEDANLVDVEFTIDEGNQVTIREIRFSGNTFASDSTLRGTMQSKEQSLFNRGRFQESQLEQDRNRLERYYRERGFVDAEVVEVNREFERDEDEEQVYLTLTIFIEEGEQYTFGGVSFEGNAIFTDEELGEEISLEEGEVLDLNQFQADFQSVADLYYQNGYIFNTINRNEVRDEDDNVISYEVEIVERGRAHIENIIIRGNDKTKDHVITRELPLEVGDVFSATRIRRGIRNLANLQYFSNITPETPQGSAEGLMDLIVNVEEGNTADIRFGVAFGGGTDFPVSAQVSWQDRNFLGRGQNIGVQGTFSPIDQRVSFNFREPWLFGEQWSGGLDFTVSRTLNRNVRQDLLSPRFDEEDEDAVPDPYTGEYVFSEDTTYDGTDYEAGDSVPDDLANPSSSQINDNDLVTDYEYAGGVTAAIPEEYLMQYTEWSMSLGANTGYRFPTQLGRVSVGTGLRTSLDYITYDQSLYRPFDPEVRDNFERWQFVNSWSANSALDTRDLVISPSSGYYLSQRATFTGGPLFGVRHFIRTDSKGQFFQTLWDFPVFSNWNWKMVLGLNSEISFIFPQFWVPEEYRDRPQPVATTSNLLFIDGMFNARGWDRRVDGEALWYNWLEFRMPLAEQVIWWDQFFDAAALWQNRDDMGELGVENMLFSFGTGFRFTIPQFPIRIYLARRFTIEDGDIVWQTGGLFNPDNEQGRGMEFVFSIGTELF
ncbi:MAG: outer membrane protein assembly factor BamA [Spirochaetes bacterium]|jgi:outer membrane protein insertion porin family|nr:outer membrane protein assembly factor BamA [Spirochaetota bacterium]